MSDKILNSNEEISLVKNNDEHKVCRHCGRCGKKHCEQEVKKNIENKQNDYVSTLGAGNKMYVRPYTEIGHYNEAREGKPRNDEMER